MPFGISSNINHEYNYSHQLSITDPGGHEVTQRLRTTVSSLLDCTCFLHSFNHVWVGSWSLARQIIDRKPSCKHATPISIAIEHRTLGRMGQAASQSSYDDWWDKVKGPFLSLYEPGYNGTSILILMPIFMFIDLVAVALRFYARSLTSQRCGLDDWLVLASLAGQAVLSSIAISSVVDGVVGHHLDWWASLDPPPSFRVVNAHADESVAPAMKYVFAFTIIYFAIESLSKLAIVIFYRRLFSLRIIRTILDITAAVMVLQNIVGVTVSLAACGKNFSDRWSRDPEAGQKVTCLVMDVIWDYMTYPEILTAAIVFIVPLPIVWRLKTATRVKVALTVTFLMGSLGFVSSIVRLILRHGQPTNFTFDPTWEAAKIYISYRAELSAYLVSACMLLYRPIVERWIKLDAIGVARKNTKTATLGRTTLNVNTGGGTSDTSTGNPSCTLGPTCHLEEGDAIELLNNGSKNSPGEFGDVEKRLCIIVRTSISQESEPRFPSESCENLAPQVSINASSRC
ncbi:hypothetical protein B0T17DRAFT_603427 [Bombardia bombarda]|uniref:Rhodopsin domain-containing protein n=1 Tax=Bombardia bombarda TaxID=252184 RepID=A0AA39W9Q7_9PEZI|nr:hypothetical protein B0T17DRAFT_603427 [Bombardia bombarda]